MLAALTACAEETAGRPSAADAPPSPTTTEPDYYSLARLCDLLSPEEARQLGGSPEGEKGNALNDGHTICAMGGRDQPRDRFQEGTSTAQADTGQSITNTPTTIDGLPAVQALSTDTVVICEILVDLPSGKMFASSVTVLTAGEGRYDPYNVASELANLVIPPVKDQ
jgi:hypothetical protein